MRLKRKSNAAKINRRDFLKTAAGASAGLATGVVGLPKRSIGFTDDPSRVVIVTDEQANSGSSIQPDIVRLMVDSGIQALTDTASPQDAWLTLFPDLALDMLTGIKISTICSSYASHPEVSIPIAESLASTPVGSFNYPVNQVVIWDRFEYELQAAGYQINTSNDGVRCFGTNHAGIGYNTELLNINGSYQRVSKCFTDYSDNLINLCLLKNHSFSGLSHALKNHYGTVHYPDGLHDNNCDPFIPALNAALRDNYNGREKLIICDAIFGVYQGGPIQPPQVAPKKLIISQDPVAVDAICREILDGYGCTTLYMSQHIDTASQAPYNLGNSELADIEVIEIENPSSHIGAKPGELSPGKISLGNNYPEPFNGSTVIPIELDKYTEINLKIYDILGRRIATLYQGTLSPGKHNLSWNGRTKGGAIAASGSYFVRMEAAGRFYTRKITLLR